jgi:hypothetical protein
MAGRGTENLNPLNPLFAVPFTSELYLEMEPVF